MNKLWEKVLPNSIHDDSWNLRLHKVNGVYSLIDVIVLPKLLQECSWFITCLYCLTKSVTQIVFLKVALSPWSMLRDVVLDGRCTTLTLAWKSSMNRAWSTDEEQKNVEWDILLQAIFLYLQDKVVEKPVLENGLCNTGFGVTLPYNRKRVLGYVFKGSWFLWMINQERLQLHIPGTIATKQELAYPFLLYSMASTFPTYWCNFDLDTLPVQSYLSSVQFSQSLSHVWLFATPWIAARQASLSITNSPSPPKPMSTESVMPSNHLILCCPLLLLPSILSSIRVFSNESALHIRWPKNWSFSFNISPSNEHPGLISFSMDWLDLLAVQGTLKSLSQHHSSKASILLHSAFFIVQLSHPYMTTGKTTALTRQTFVGRVMSLLFNMLSRLVITFLPRSKRLLISWWQSPSALISEPRKTKSGHCFPIYLPWSDGTGCHDLKFSECWALSQLFHSPLSLTSRGSLVLHFLP